MFNNRRKPDCLWLDDGLKRFPGLGGFLKDQFKVAECRFLDDGKSLCHSKSFDLCLVDIILPFAPGKPSIDPYPGLGFVESLLSGSLSWRPRGIAFFTVVDRDKLGGRYAEICQSAEELGVMVEYFNKRQIILQDNEVFVDQLEGLLSLGGLRK